MCLLFNNSNWHFWSSSKKNSECQQTAYVWIKLSKKETIQQEHDSFDFNIFLSGMLNQIFKYELSLYFVDKKEVILQMICKHQSYGIPYHI